MKKSNLKSVFTALFAALISVGSIVTIPIGTVPIVLQNFFAVLSGLLLGPIQGAGAVGLFLLVGGLGLPVFSGGRSGTAVFASPTGGYLLGYFISALVAGLTVRKASLEDKSKALPVILSSTISAFIAMYIPGILVLKRSLKLSTANAIKVGLIPFLPFDLVKIAILVIITLKLRPIITRYLTEDLKQ